MPRPTPERSTARPRAVGFVAAACLGVCLASTTAVAQGIPTRGEQSAYFVDPRDITLERIAQAERRIRCETRQIRRVRDEFGMWIEVEESLFLGGVDARGRTRFRLEFERVVGAQLTQTQIQRRQFLYRYHAPYLFESGSFRIHDVARARQNYVLTFIGAHVHRGRPVYRVAVVPSTIDRSAWLLDIDKFTGYPLNRLEMAPDGTVLSALETVDFLNLQGPPSAGWWTPVRRIEEHATLQDALAVLPGASFTVPPTTSLPTGYDITSIRTLHDVLANEQTLLFVYSDGIDELMVGQTTNALPPSLPSIPAGGTSTPYAVYEFSDFNVAQWSFHTNGLSHLIVGRPATSGLRDFVTDFLRAALGV